MVVVALVKVVVVVAVVSAVDELLTFRAINGFFSLSNIFSLSLLPKSLFQGIRPLITLDVVVELITVTERSVCATKTGLIVGGLGVPADVKCFLETSGCISVCAMMGVSVLCKNGGKVVSGFGTCLSGLFFSSLQSEK